jgi:hypothetical protein
MKKWLFRLYIPALLLLVTFGMFSIWKFGYEPAPTRTMDPSYFDSPEAIGTSMYLYFYPAIETKHIIAIGVTPQPDWNRAIVRGFLLEAVKREKPFEMIIAEEQMPVLDVSGLPQMELTQVSVAAEDQTPVVNAVKRAIESKKRTLLYLPSVFSTHVLKDNAIHRLETALGTNLLALTVGPLALKENQEYLVQPPCVGAERDSNGTSALGCEYLKAGRQLYRKKLEQKRWVAIMNEPKPAQYAEDYLLMISEPNQGANAAEENHALRMDAPPASR